MSGNYGSIPPPSTSRHDKSENVEEGELIESSESGNHGGRGWEDGREGGRGLGGTPRSDFSNRHPDWNEAHHRPEWNETFRGGFDSYRMMQYEREEASGLPYRNREGYRSHNTPSKAPAHYRREYSLYRLFQFKYHIHQRIILRSTLRRILRLPG